jgi:hypothetical protein
MTRDMRFRGEVALLFGLVLASCYGTPRTSVPDGGGGTGGGGAPGTGGTAIGGNDGAARGGAAGTSSGGSSGRGGSAGGGGASGKGGSAAGRGGGDGSSLAIAIARPASPTYTNKAIEIGINVSGSGPSPAVQLLDNGILLTTLSTNPYVFTWDTTTAAEGSHQLVAQAAVGGQIVSSAPVTIVVDRSPPSIVSRSPGSGDGNVSLTDPVQIVFSEAIAGSSVTATAVRLTLGSAAVASMATLGADGKTIGAVIADRASLGLPGTMTETVATSITDLAGNPFAGASWSFSVPLWVDLGTVAGYGPKIMLDPSGVPVVMTRTSSLQIARYAGGTNWDTSIPSPNTAATGTGDFSISPSGEIFVAWTESSSQPVHVARWTGATWDRSYGTLLTSPTASAEGVQIAHTSTGQPVVRWVEPITMGRGPGYVSRWTGSSWTPYADAPGDYSGPIVLDRSDFPIVEAGYRISRWTGSSWISPLGMNLFGLAINSSDQAVALQVEFGSSIQPVGLSKTGVLADYVPGLAGQSPDGIASYRVAIDNLDKPIVTWHSNVDGTFANAQLHVARWTGAEWDQRYGIFTNAGDYCSIVLAGAAVPVVAWQDFAGSSTHVSKSNH